MGDRTFTAEDVLRIYEFFLDSDEQETVENFFREEEEPEEEPEPDVLREDFDAVIGLLRQLLGVLPAAANFLLTFSFFIAVASVIQFVVAQANILVNDLIEREVIDA